MQTRESTHFAACVLAHPYFRRSAIYRSFLVGAARPDRESSTAFCLSLKQNSGIQIERLRNFCTVRLWPLIFNNHVVPRRRANLVSPWMLWRTSELRLSRLSKDVSLIRICIAATLAFMHHPSARSACIRTTVYVYQLARSQVPPRSYET